VDPVHFLDLPDAPPLPFRNTTFPIGDPALGASMNSSGHVFWGDDLGVHRLVF
jgi:hypothetical protein